MSDFVELLRNAFNCDYPKYKGQGTSNGIEFQEILSNISDYISRKSSTYNMEVENSVGIGRWSAVPWIRIFYSDISPSAQDGVYIVYLFAASGNSVFITLNQGTTDSSNEKRNKIRKIIQERISSRQFLKNQGNLSFGDNKNYGAAAIFYKEYKVNNLPSEDEMNEDLISLLEIYKECRKKGLLEDTVYNDKNIKKEEYKNTRKTEASITVHIKNFHISDFEEKESSIRYICSLLAKPFVILTGNSGTGKTHISTYFAEYLEKQDDAGMKNHLLVPVGADWTDNTKILGYYNPLANNGAGQYEKTDIFKFIKRASANPDIPYFLTLDEMNLSHVERYFSDFLSKMELVDYKNSEKKTYFDIPEYGRLEFPRNLFITGTVNIDETTYMFSPKVLDRANVIEFKPKMDDVLGNLLSPSENNPIKPAELGVAEGFMKLANDVRSGNIPDEVKPILNDMKPILEAFYKELEKSGFEFSYRTVKEIRLYTIAAWLTAEDTKPTPTEIADVQILQKILPKIHGNRKQIGELLDNLENLCTEKELNNSLSKICQMKDHLNRFQYTSFI